MHRLLRALLAISLTIPSLLRAQDESLRGAAERARRAWSAHDPVGLVGGSPRVQVQLPGADPSAALGPGQTAALLGDFISSAQEVETTVRAAREVTPGSGYVELQRRYRVAGTQDIRVQVLLLSYRLTKAGWRLVEVRVVDNGSH